MNEQNFQELISAIESVGQANGWVILGTLIAMLLSILTGLYVWFTYGLLKKTAESTEIVRDNIFQQRLIEVSNQWNSVEFIRARNLANVQMEDAIDKAALPTLYDHLKTTAQTEEWIYISLITHFFVRLETLVRTQQIDEKRVAEEFTEQVRHWCPNLKIIYDGFNEKEKRISEALSRLHRRFTGTELPSRRKI
jgi:hypothetical protein